MSEEPHQSGPHGPLVFEGGGTDNLEDLSNDEVTPGELREFLAADHLETYADPSFKERLRKRLWNFVRNRYGAGSSSSDS